MTIKLGAMPHSPHIHNSIILIPLDRAFICLLWTTNGSRVSRLELRRQDIFILPLYITCWITLWIYSLHACSTNTSFEGASNDVKVLRPMPCLLAVATMWGWHSFRSRASDRAATIWGWRLFDGSIYSKKYSTYQLCTVDTVLFVYSDMEGSKLHAVRHLRSCTVGCLHK